MSAVWSQFIFATEVICRCFLPPEAASLVRLYVRHVLASWLADSSDGFGGGIEIPQIFQKFTYPLGAVNIL
jgi:hypothetical protein